METTSTNEKLTISQSSGKPIEIKLKTLKQSASVLRAIKHKLRQTILLLIDEQKQICVTDIYERLKLEQSVASQHLAILRKADIVKTERKGKSIFYTVNKTRLALVARIINELA